MGVEGAGYGHKGEGTGRNEAESEAHSGKCQNLVRVGFRAGFPATEEVDSGREFQVWESRDPDGLQRGVVLQVERDQGPQEALIP